MIRIIVKKEILMKTNTINVWTVFSIITITLLCLFDFSYAETTITGKWEGKVEIPDTPLGITVKFTETDSIITGTIDIPKQDVKKLKLNKIIIDCTKISFIIPKVSGDPIFKGTIADDRSTIKGTFSQSGKSVPFILKRRKNEKTCESLEEGLDN